MSDSIKNKLEEYKKYKYRANEIKELLDIIRQAAKNNDIETINELHNLIGGDSKDNNILKMIDNIKILLEDYETKWKDLEKLKNDKNLELLNIYIDLENNNDKI